MARIIEAHEFEAEVLKSALPVVVDVFATWCGPCRMVAPVFDAVSVKMHGVCKFVKLNYDECAAIVARYGVSGIPAFLYFNNGRLVGMSAGYKDQGQLIQEANRFFAL